MAVSCRSEAGQWRGGDQHTGIENWASGGTHLPGVSFFFKGVAVFPGVTVPRGRRWTLYVGPGSESVEAKI